MPPASPRSEEHTSELQSHVNLVCRLLLAPAPPPTHTLSLHDALPICRVRSLAAHEHVAERVDRERITAIARPAGQEVARRLVLRREREAAQPAARGGADARGCLQHRLDRKSTRLNSSHMSISYAVFCLLRRPPPPTLFPYTTLFRSAASAPSRRTNMLPSASTASA